MNRFILRSTLPSLCFFMTAYANAQYQPPQNSIATTGIWIGIADMSVPGITGGQTNNTVGAGGSQGYTNYAMSSYGTVTRGCTIAPTVTIQNCNNAGTKQYNFKLYADWDGDLTFDDPGETLININSAINSGGVGACLTDLKSLSFTVPLYAKSGDVRFRWALAEGTGNASPNGGYTGEIEDYSLTVATNAAPLINNSGNPAFNTLIASQTDNPGQLIARLIESTLPSVVMITDESPCVDVTGIAIIGSTTPNGIWQYQIGAGAWTPVGARDISNALLLTDSSRLRFVPSGEGTATITFKAWDQTTGSNGASANTTTSGGTSAFSTATESASVVVNSNASADNDLTVYMTSQYRPGTNQNITTSQIGTTAKQYDVLTTGNLGNGTDIALDDLNGNIYWLGGESNGSLMRSSTSGTNVDQLIAPEGITLPSGIALGDNSVFFIDNFSIFVTNLEGEFTNVLPLPGAGVGTSGDLEFSSGKLYFTFQNDFDGPHVLYSMNADGTGTAALYTFTGIPNGLDIANGNVYWSELNGTTSTIRYRAITGGTVNTLATETDRIWRDLIVNTANSRIYFADMDLNGLDGYVKSIPRTGGTVVREVLLDNAVSSIALYRDPSTLPVKFISVNAWVQDSRNMVEWVIAQEENVDHYVVERSSNGRSYTDIGTVAASNRNAYQFTDGAPLTGLNIYRIKAVDIDGKELYSPIVRLVRDDVSKGVAVYPTLVTNKQFTLRLQNLHSGSYQMQVINNLGQPVMTQRVTHNTGVTANTINLPSTISKGVYRVVVISDEEKYTTNIVVQ
ncbi:MAG: GEVED domain-containing protein [Chitinophagaceae bacterium]